MKTVQFFFMAFLTWLITNGVAAVLYLLMATLGFEFDPFLCLECYGTLSIVLFFGLIFSAPFSIFLPVIFIVIEKTEAIRHRVILALVLITGLCVTVIVAFITLFGTEEFDILTVVTFLTPYVLGAIGSFMLIGRRIIFRERPAILTITDHLIDEHES